MPYGLPSTTNQTIEVLSFDGSDNTYEGVSHAHLTKLALSIVWFRCDTKLNVGCKYTGDFKYDPHQSLSNGLPTFTPNP